MACQCWIKMAVVALALRGPPRVPRVLGLLTLSFLQTSKTNSMGICFGAFYFSCTSIQEGLSTGAAFWYYLDVGQTAVLF